MLYREIAPVPALAGHVECVWWLSGALSGADARAQKVVPDGCSELIVNLGAPFHALDPAGVAAPRAQPALSFAGQLSRFLMLAPPQHLDVLGIRFQPAGASALFGPVIAELTDRVAAVEALDPELARALESAVAGAADPRARVRRAQAVLLRRLRRETSADALVRTAAQHLVAADGALRVDSLAEALGVSARHLDRLFKPRAGVGPKQLAQTLRFQSVFRAVERHRVPAWVTVAVRCGYFDQAHLTRAFQRFAGETPAAFFASAGLLTHAFTREHRLSDSYKTAAAPTR